MADLKVKYAGLELKNPLIVGACTLTSNVESAKAIEAAGASAIVFKSLFEEQIQMESAQLADELDEYTERNAEMISIFPHMEHAGPKKHLMALKKVKEAVNIPVIASLNCIYDVSWFDYAKQLEDVGVDALELNFYSFPSMLDKSASEIEEQKIEIVRTLNKRLSIPISIKLSPYYTNLLNFVDALDKAGADSFVLFNRLFQPSINTLKESHVKRFNLSHQGDYKLALRYIGYMYSKINASFCGSNGVYSSEDVIQMMLSGASCVQMVSVIYKNKPKYISQVLKELNAWMDSKNYKTVDEFVGKMSDHQLRTSDVYYRAQYLDYILNPDEILNKYPMR